MNEITSIKVKPGDKKLLAIYKIENDLPSLSDAIRHAIEHASAQGGDYEPRT